MADFLNGLIEVYERLRKVTGRTLSATVLTIPGFTSLSLNIFCIFGIFETDFFAIYTHLSTQVGRYTWHMVLRIFGTGVGEEKRWKLCVLLFALTLGTGGWPEDVRLSPWGRRARVLGENNVCFLTVFFDRVLNLRLAWVHSWNDLVTLTSSFNERYWLTLWLNLKRVLRSFILSPLATET